MAEREDSFEELTDVEAVLRSLTIRKTGIDRDRLMFQMGQAAATADFALRYQRLRLWRWAALVSAASAAVLAGILVRDLEPRTMHVADSAKRDPSSVVPQESQRNVKSQVPREAAADRAPRADIPFAEFGALPGELSSPEGIAGFWPYTGLRNPARDRWSQARSSLPSGETAPPNEPATYWDEGHRLGLWANQYAETSGGPHKGIDGNPEFDLGENL